MTHQSKLLSWLGAFLLTICVAGLSGCSDWLDGFETPGTVREATLRVGFETHACLAMRRESSMTEAA